MDKGGFVYIMASGRNGTLYTGVTSDLPIRVAQHKDGTFGGFTHKYGCKRLVWFEQHGDIETALFGRSGSRAGTVCGSCD